jgi:hypothetical protein
MRQPAPAKIPRFYPSQKVESRSRRALAESKGLEVAAMGKADTQWPNGERFALWANKDENYDLMTIDQLRKVKSSLTLDEVEKIRDYYSAVYWSSKARVDAGEARTVNPSALQRALLMEFYLKNWEYV